MGIRHEVFALAREGIKQGAIAARVGLTRATVNRILKRHAATGSLVPGKSSGAPRKTTPRQDIALLRMVRQDRFLSARALTARMRNLYGMRAGRTTVNKWQARESTGMFGNLMAIYYIMPQFIQNHSRFVMLMKTCMIS